MSRSLSASMQDAVVAPSVKPIILVEAQFQSGTLYLWNGVGDLSWNSETWIGAGAILEVSPVEESVELKATGAKVNVSGIPSEYISLSFQEPYQGRGLIIRLGLMDDSNSIVDSPTIIFSGRMDIMNISESGDTSVIEITVENRLIDFERPRIRRYTDQDQKIEFPNDKGLEYVTSIQDKELVWGRV